MRSPKDDAALDVVFLFLAMLDPKECSILLRHLVADAPNANWIGHRQRK